MARSKYAEVCEEVCTHPEILGRVAPEMPDEERLYDLAELFKVFGDTTRIRILTSAPSSARAWSISKKSMGGKEHEKDL